MTCQTDRPWYRKTTPIIACGLIFCLSPSAVIARAPDEAAQSLVARTLRVLSAGRDAAEVTGVVLDGREIVQDLVENDHPVTPPFYNRSANAVTRYRDFNAGIERDETRSGETTITTLMGHDVSVTFNAGDPSKRQVASAPPAWSIHDPVMALRLAARAPDLSLGHDVLWHGSAQHMVSFHDGRYPVTIFIDAGTGLPSATEAVVTYDDARLSGAIAWNALGDVLERTEYMNWSFVDGIRYPLQQDQLTNSQLSRTFVASAARLTGLVDAQGLLSAPKRTPAFLSVQSLTFDKPVPGGPYPGKPVQEIAPGIIQIPNSWYTAIVRQDDGLVIIDAPISAGYSKSVLDEAARHFPGVPVKAVITSTGFFWHVAGIREYAARGIPIYAEARNIPVIEEILKARHGLAPDALALNQRADWKLVAVSGKTTLGKGANAVEIYPVSCATQPMLMTYVRSAGLLHTGEMVQPLGPNGEILFPESLIELAETLRMDAILPDRIIGMHMSPTPWAAVLETLKAAGARIANDTSGC